MPAFTKFATTHCTEISLEDLCAEILYAYLFKGSSVKQIETDLFGQEEFNGFLSKTVLNYYGIDTSPNGYNRGIYKYSSPMEVVRQLLSSTDPVEKCVGEILAHKIPFHM